MQGSLGTNIFQIHQILFYARGMNRLLLLFAAICLALPMTVQAKETKMTESEAQALQLALNRGLDLIRYDQAAWHTTDTLREDVPALSDSGIRGWVVTQVESGLLVTFWKRDGEAYVGVYSAIWNKDGVTERRILSGKDTALSDFQRGLIEAQQLVLKSGFEFTRCSQAAFNSVVLPPTADGDPILVYFLVPQADFKSVPLGKHYRFSVKDGKIESHRSFSNSCISLPLGLEKGKGKPEALTISHLLDPVPTEIHIFSTFAAKLPIYVITSSNNHIWSAEIISGQPRVRLIK